MQGLAPDGVLKSQKKSKLFGWSTGTARGKPWSSALFWCILDWWRSNREMLCSVWKDWQLQRKCWAWHQLTGTGTFNGFESWWSTDQLIQIHFSAGVIAHIPKHRVKGTIPDCQTGNSKYGLEISNKIYNGKYLPNNDNWIYIMVLALRFPIFPIHWFQIKKLQKFQVLWSQDAMTMMPFGCLMRQRIR